MRCTLVAAICLCAGIAGADSQKPADVAREVDRLIVAEVGLSPGDVAPEVSEAVYLRRAYLDLVGAIPPPEVISNFVEDPHPQKRRRLVNDLLERPEYGVSQARYWRDVILHRRLEDRALAVSAALVEDLAKWINDGETWDRIAERFITATGSAQENGEIAILMAQDGRTEEIAAEVSRVFLGVQIQCAQCHDHPWDEWKREQFHELAAFFPRVGVRPVRGARPFDAVVNVADRPDRPFLRNGANLNRRGRPEHYMRDLERPDEVGQRIEPRFFLTSLSLPAGTRDSDRRSALAADLTRTDWFATALVNRYWAELIGEGFYEPVDDLGPTREPSAPGAVKALANGFAESGYDLRWLHRTILATDAYARQSRPRRAPDEKPFAASVAQPLRGDQLFDAVLAALDVDESKLKRIRTSTMVRIPGGATPRLLFTGAFGYDPSAPRESVQATIPQALARMNTPPLNLAVRALPRTVLGKLLWKHGRDPRAITEALYLRTLSRPPTDEEIGEVMTHVDEVGRPAFAMEDVLWALLNSAEFSHRR